MTFRDYFNVKDIHVIINLILFLVHDKVAKKSQGYQSH